MFGFPEMYSGVLHARCSSAMTLSDLTSIAIPHTDTWDRTRDAVVESQRSNRTVTSRFHSLDIFVGCPIEESGRQAIHVSGQTTHFVVNISSW